MSQGYRSTDQTFKNSAILQGWRLWNGLTTAIQPTPTPPPFPTPMGTILSWFLMRSPTRDPWTNSLTETHAVPIYQHICAKLSKWWLREKSIPSLRTEWSLFVRLESLSPKDALKLAHRFFKICQVMFFRYFVTTCISHWKRMWPSYGQTWIPFTKGCIVLGLFEIGHGVLEKNIFLILSLYFRYFLTRSLFEKKVVLNSYLRMLCAKSDCSGEEYFLIRE